MSHNITVESGSSVRLTTGGKYCDRDIVVTATGGAEDLNAVLTEQEELIAELQEVLREKASGAPVIEPLSITDNGTYTAPDGVDGYSPITVNVPDYVEQYCNNELETYSNPRLTIVSMQVFRYKEHKYYYLPNVESVKNWCFAQSKICDIALPKATAIEWDAFRECNNLTQVDLGAATYIQTRTFYNSKALVTLIVRTNALIPLYNTDAFTGTPIASGTGYIYVPRAFLSDTDANKDYRRASNWSVFSAQFRAIEDYPEICGGDS